MTESENGVQGRGKGTGLHATCRMKGREKEGKSYLTGVSPGLPTRPRVRAHARTGILIRALSLDDSTVSNR